VGFAVATDLIAVAAGNDWAVGGFGFESATTQRARKIGQPDAEGAEISQKKYPKNTFLIFFLRPFCYLCVTFAIAAFGCPAFNICDQ
jgi:hypothetical protein